MIYRTPLTFVREDLHLAGQLFRNTDRLDVRQPAVIVTGSWLTVKEQMPELCATRLAERGHAAFTFDFSGFGGSAGEPRQAELPDRKIADLIAAAEFLSTLSLIESNAISQLAICASAQYGLEALARGSRVSRFISVAGAGAPTPVFVASFAMLRRRASRCSSRQSQLASCVRGLKQCAIVATSRRRLALLAGWAR
jgi:dienelactone hydrolase